MTAVIAGCGDLGTEVGLRLHAAGHRVIGLRRTPGVLPAPIEGRCVDLSIREPTLPAGTDLVVIALTADERNERGYKVTYVDGLNHLLDGLWRSGARPSRVVLVSSTSVYGDRAGGWVDERTPTTPAAPTASVLRHAEKTLHSRIPTATILRLGGLYGPGRTRLIDRVRDGSAAEHANPAAFTNRIHRDDAAAAIVHLAVRIESPAPCYLGVDNEPATYADVVRHIAASIGLDRPAFPNAVADVSGKRCRNDRLLATDFRFAYPTYREGYATLSEEQ